MFVPPGKPQTLPLFCHHLCLSTNASDTQYTSRQHLQIRYLVPSTLKSKSELYVPEHPLLSHLSMTATTFPLTAANPFPPTHNNSECCYKDLDLSLLTSVCFFPFKSSTACLYCQESASLDFQICLLFLSNWPFFHLAGACSLRRTTSFYSFNSFSRVLLCWGVIREKYNKDSETPNYRKEVQHHFLYKLSKKFILEAIKHLPV